MKNSVFICGPQGCGKTTNAKAFAKRLGLSNIVDDWSLGQNFNERGTLYLTNKSEGEVAEVTLGGGADLTVIDYDKAAKQWL